MRFSAALDHKHYTKRLVIDVTMIGVIASVAVMAELVKHGHFPGLFEIATHFWAWVCHACTDVAMAEVVATAVFRIAGTVE